jgi:hypothetical protein
MTNRQAALYVPVHHPNAEMPSDIEAQGTWRIGRSLRHTCSTSL